MENEVKVNFDDEEEVRSEMEKMGIKDAVRKRVLYNETRNSE